MLRQNFSQQPMNDQVRISQGEMRQMIELYDQQIGIAGRSSTPTSQTHTQTDQPTIADVAELLGISPLEAQRLLMQAREQEQQKAAAQAARLREQNRATVSAFSPQQTTVSPQQVTVVQNVILDSHAPLFQKFDANRGNYMATWNWGAFWFGPLWYFYKGMWGKGLLYIFFYMVLTGTTAGVFAPLAPFVFAMLGNYDYYLFRCHDTQLWDKRRSMTAIVNPYHRGATTTVVPPVAAPPKTVAGTGTENLEQMAQKLQLLRETYERGLITLAEFEEKRLWILNEVENQANLKTLADAHRLGLLTDEEYHQKRQALLRR